MIDAVENVGKVSMAATRSFRDTLSFASMIILKMFNKNEVIACEDCKKTSV